MNTEDLEKLYKETMNDAAPDFWDSIESQLKPHAGLSEDEKNAFAGLEPAKTDGPEPAETAGPEPKPADTPVPFRRPGRFPAAGWVAAAVFAACIPIALVFSGTISSRQYAAAETEAAAEAEAAAEEPMAYTAAAVPAEAMTEAAPAVTEAAPAVTEAAPAVAETAAGNTDVRLLSVPDRAVTVPADTWYFTEDVLADTDMLVLFTVTRAEFLFDPDGSAYRLRYSGTVNESLLEDGESGQPGSELLLLSPIVSDATPGSTVLYQLVPGQVYILPLKKENGDWYLVYPYAPQIRLHEDGSFEFHTGYASLLNNDTAALPGSPASEDDFWFDRIVVRSDEEFVRELTELVEFRKKEKISP